MSGIEKLVDFILGWIRVLRFWLIVDEDQHGIVLRFGRFGIKDRKAIAWATSLCAGFVAALIFSCWALPFVSAWIGLEISYAIWDSLLASVAFGLLSTFGWNGRRVGPGLHLKLFAWDEEFVVAKSQETTNLAIQSLYTPNGIKLQGSGIFKWAVKDPALYFIEIGSNDEGQGESSFCNDLAYGAIADYILTHNWPFNIEEAKKEILAAIRAEANSYGFKIYSFKFDNFIPCNALRLFME